MYHLSLEKIVHKELKASNILVTTHGTAKITGNIQNYFELLTTLDFGLGGKFKSKDNREEGYFSLTKQKLIDLTTTRPLRWFSPESLKGNIFNEKSDVYMFGCTCLEVKELTLIHFGNFFGLDHNKRKTLSNNHK